MHINSSIIKPPDYKSIQQEQQENFDFISHMCNNQIEASFLYFILSIMRMRNAIAISAARNAERSLLSCRDFQNAE